MMQQSEMKYRHDYTPPHFDVDSVYLTIDLRETEVTVTNTMWLNSSPKHPSTSLTLQGREQTLHSVKLNDETLASHDYELTEDELTLRQVPQDELFKVEIVSSHCPDQNTQLIGLYRSQGNYCTQCESDGFSKITYFTDRPDVLTVFTTEIWGSKHDCPVMLSNGNRIKEYDIDSANHAVVWHDPFLKPCYLFALVAGNLGCFQDSFVTRSNREIDLRIYAEPQSISQCNYAMQALKKAMRWDEDYYEREYDLDTFMIVAVNDFNFGAMENKGLNVFNDRFILVDPETATDRDYAAVDIVVSHEYFHNWSGNRITLRDWFDICLKEGLTVFREQSFSETMGDASVERIDQIKRLREIQFPEDSGPLAHPVRPDAYLEMNNFYTPTVYEKGSEIIRMLNNLVGDRTFRQGVMHYFDKFDGQAVTCDDWLDAMAEGTGYDLSQFRKWYSQIGTPRLTITDDYDPDAQQYHLSIEQKLGKTPLAYPDEPMQMPIAVGLLSPQGQPYLQPDTQVLDLHQWQQTFTFEGISERPIPSLLRQFSAPVQWHYDYDDETLAFLVRNDTEGVARWEASQLLVERLLIRLVKAYQNQTPWSDTAIVSKTLQVLLSNSDDNPALLAEILGFPSNTALLQHFDALPVDAVLASRQYFQHHIIESNKQLWFDVYRHYNTHEPYHYTQEQVAKRKLKNQILQLLAQSGCDKQSTSELAWQQFNSANNMTDEYAALLALNQLADDNTKKANQTFYERWRDQPLVMDKWLTAQAASTASDTLANVKALLKSSVYRMTNPNKVRALLGVFGRNFTAFHREPEYAYPFYVDQILAIDAVNPLVSAKLATNLSNWASLADPHGSLMREQLQRIYSQADISNDLYEIVDKSLTTQKES